MPMRGSLTSRSKSSESADCRSAPTRSVRWPAMGARSIVQELELLVTELGDLHVVDVAHDLAQRRIHERLVGADLRDAEQPALPQIVVARFGDRHVELVADPSLDRAQHAPLPLQ